MIEANSGEVNTPPNAPLIPVSVYCASASGSSCRRRWTSHVPMPPPATTMANDGPRLAPVDQRHHGDDHEFRRHLGVDPCGFAHGDGARELSLEAERLAHRGDQHRTPSREQDPPPLAGPRVRGRVAEQLVAGPGGDDRERQGEDPAEDTEVDGRQQLPAVPGLGERQHRRPIGPSPRRGDAARARFVRRTGSRTWWAPPPGRQPSPEQYRFQVGREVDRSPAEEGHVCVIRDR